MICYFKIVKDLIIKSSLESQTLNLGVIYIFGFYVSVQREFFAKAYIFQAYIQFYPSLQHTLCTLAKD